MSPSQRFQQDSKASDQQQQRDLYYSGDFDDTEEPTTPRPTRHAYPSAEEDSGSETETESTRQQGKRKKSKGKEKEKSSKDKDSKDRHHHRHHQPQDQPKQQQQPQQAASMPSSRSGKMPSSSRRHATGKSKGKAKTDDWSEVTDPEERRRIQNRIAQRKFREKAREQKERAERDQRNQEHAASSYAVPGPDDLGVDDVLSGVPWGGPSLRYVMAKGHESANTHLSGSRRASDYLPDEGGYSSSSVSGVSGATMAAPLTAGTMAGSTAGYAFSEENQNYFQYLAEGNTSGESSRSGSDFSQAPLSQGQYFDDSSSFYYDYEYDYDSAGR